MTNSPRPTRKAAAAAAAAGVALALWGGAAVAQDGGISIYFVGCAAPTGFHGCLARGAAEAGDNLGVKVARVG